jgi:DNA processing protein
MNRTEIIHGIALKRVPHIGDVLAKQLLSYCGSTSEVFKQKKNSLLKIPGLGQKSVESILAFKDFDTIENELVWAESKGIKPLFYLDPAYPFRLKDCEDSPFFIFVKGETDLNNTKVLSIVGTRNASPYGKEFCRDLALALKDTNCLLVSGLAYGIDTCVHKEALKNELPTAAVLAHGLKYISPNGNRNLAKEMLAHQGCLITEHFSDDPPQPENFPKRNRIVAGMCDGLIIVESGIRGGSMITAELAWGYNRELFALPGRINDPYSLGCNKLIHNTRAICIESPDKLVEYLGWKKNEKADSKPKLIPTDLSESEKKIYAHLRNGEKQIDDLHFLTGIALSSLSMVLLDLEFKGLVHSLPGKKYKLIL